jgi:hypothetical protein
MKNLYESLLSDMDIDRDLNDMALIKNRYIIHHSYTPNSNTKLNKLFDIRKLKSYINNNDLVANANFMNNIFKGISNTNIIHAQAINTILGNIEDNANLDIVKQNIDNIFTEFYKVPIEVDVRYWGSTKNLVIVFKSKDLRTQDYYYIRFDKRDA